MAAEKKTINILLKLFALILTLAVVLLAAGVIYLTSHMEQFEQWFVAEVEKATGRSFAAKDVHLALSLQPAVTLKDVSLANADWSDRPRMLTASSLTLKLDMLPLLNGVVAIEELLFENPELVVETDSRGTGNWDFAAADTAPGESVAGDDNSSLDHEIEIRRVEISNGQYVYRNGVSGENDSLRIDEFTGQAIDATGRFEYQLRLNDEQTSFRSQGVMDSVRNFLHNKPYQYDLTVEYPGGELHGKGRLERPMDFSGWDLELTVKADKTSDLAWLAGRELPEFGPLEASARIREENTGYRLEPFQARIGASDLSGAISFVTDRKRLKIVSQLSAGELGRLGLDEDKVVEALSEPVKEIPEASDGEEPSKRMFAAEPLPFPALQQFDADISLHADKFNLTGNPLQNFNVKILLQDGLLSVTDASVDVGDGKMTAMLDINSNFSPPTVSTRIRASGVDLGEWLRATRDEDILTGSRMDGDIELSSQGNSISELAAGLNGRIWWVAGEGTLRYDVGLADQNLVFAIAKKLNPLTKEENDIRLNCWTVHYDIEDGIATSDRGLAFDSDKLQLLGTGTVDLHTEQFQLYVSSNSTVADLIAVGGTLAEPTIHLDPVGVFKEGASLGAAIFTLGLSKVAEYFYNWVSSGTSPCEIAQRDRTKADPEDSSDRDGQVLIDSEKEL